MNADQSDFIHSIKKNWSPIWRSIVLLNEYSGIPGCVTRNATESFPVCLDDPYLVCFDLLSTLCSVSKNKHNRQAHTYSSIRCWRLEKAPCWISLICVCLTSLLMQKQPLTSGFSTSHWSQGSQGLCVHTDHWRRSVTQSRWDFFSFHVWNKIYVKKVYTSSQALCMWSCILAAYLLHTCKYPHCSRALTFEQNIEQKRTHAWPPGRSQRISRDVCFFCHKCVLVLSVCQLYLLIGYVFLFCFFGKIDCVRRNCSCVRFDRSLNKCLGWF